MLIINYYHKMPWFDIIPYRKYPTCRTSHILNILHPEHPASRKKYDTAKDIYHRHAV